MPKIPGINHKHAIKALKKAGFEVVRQGKHIVMSDKNNPLSGSDRKRRLKPVKDRE